MTTWPNIAGEPGVPAEWRYWNYFSRMLVSTGMSTDGTVIRAQQLRSGSGASWATVDGSGIVRFDTFARGIDPVSGTDFATKQYVDSVSWGWGNESDLTCVQIGTTRFAPDDCVSLLNSGKKWVAYIQHNPPSGIPQQWWTRYFNLDSTEIKELACGHTDTDSFAYIKYNNPAITESNFPPGGKLCYRKSLTCIQIGTTRFAPDDCVSLLNSGKKWVAYIQHNPPSGIPQQWWTRYFNLDSTEIKELACGHTDTDSFAYIKYNNPAITESNFPPGGKLCY
jgi:hypothetical protein